MTIIHKAYKTELAPTEAQKELFLRCAGTARFAYNWALERKIKAREAGEKVPSKYALCSEIVTLKHAELEWLKDLPSSIPRMAIWNVDRAFENFFRRCKEGSGPKGFPKFKSKAKGIGSFCFEAGTVVEEGRIRLQKVGWVKLKQRGYIPSKWCKIIQAVVSERAGKWFVSVTVEERNVVAGLGQKGTVGVDLGAKTLATISDGRSIEGPKALARNLRKLRRLSKAVSRKVKGSANRKKAVKKLAKLHLRISNIRNYALHNLTSELAKKVAVIGIEDLSVKDMVQDKRLARVVSDVGMGEFRRQLEYKAQWYGSKVVVADRWFPSSKTCSACGAVNNELKLSDRRWKCSCGAEHDRDLNAAINLERVAAKSAETLNACGGDPTCGPDEAGRRRGDA